jgi:hypothetical protein
MTSFPAKPPGARFKSFAPAAATHPGDSNQNRNLREGKRSLISLSSSGALGPPNMPLVGASPDAVETPRTLLGPRSFGYAPHSETDRANPEPVPDWGDVINPPCHW